MTTGLAWADVSKGSGLAGMGQISGSLEGGVIDRRVQCTLYCICLSRGNSTQTPSCELEGGRDSKQDLDKHSLRHPGAAVSGTNQTWTHLSIWSEGHLPVCCIHRRRSPVPPASGKGSLKKEQGLSRTYYNQLGLKLSVNPHPGLGTHCTLSASSEH